MKTAVAVVGVLAMSRFARSQAKVEQDVQAIKSLCGCYAIDFDYTETFSPDTNYTFHEDYSARAGAELVFVIEEREGFMSIQHLLVVGGGIVIKHWREDWEYENRDLLTFNKDLNWRYEALEKEQAKGTWTQKVFQVDDSPRYQGYATWVHVDGRHFWHSKAISPLPRREYAHRSDYNVLQRNNRIELTDYGWVHEQDNAKIIRTEERDSLLVEEKGFNRYRRQGDEQCKKAMEWWGENKGYWALVREQWEQLYTKKQGVKLAAKVADESLWEALFALGDENSGAEIDKVKEVKKSIRGVIEKYTLDQSR